MRGHRTLSRWLENLFPIPQHSGPVIVRVAFGHRMLVEPRRGGLERSLFYTGAYETGTLHIISKILHEGGTFVDVGANIGLMSVRASELVSPRGRVFAFEPVPQTFTMLEYNLRLNDCSNASAYNVAVGIARETLAIYEADTLSRGSASLFHPNEPAVESSVQVDTLDHLLDASQSITALKIDVEGWEPAVLKGATRLLSRHDAPMLIVEYTDDRRAGQDGTFQELYRMIRSVNSYRLFVLARGKENPSPLREVNLKRLLPPGDNLFCFLPTHLDRLGVELFSRE